MTPARFIFAVDGGASKTEAVLRRADGGVVARHRAGPCNLYQAPDAGIAAIRACWIACAQGVPAGETCISAGLAGLSAAGAPEAFQAAFGDFAQMCLSSDGYAALTGAFGARPGALLSIGTGTVGCRIDAAGRFVQLGGWGFAAGDRGGGAWLGRQLVTEWLEHRDGAGRGQGTTDLWRAVADHVGTGRAEVLGWLRSATPGDYAQLAPALLRAADDRDDVALRLVAEGCGHISRLGEALLAGTAMPVQLAGGLAAALAPHLPWAWATLADPGAALEGAWRIGMGVRPAEYAARLDAGVPPRA